MIEAELANLPTPGEIKTIPLKVSAAKAGLQWCQITVAAEGSQDATGKASVNVVEPLLQVSQTGPAKCHVRALSLTYEIIAVQRTSGTAVTDPIALYASTPGEVSSSSRPTKTARSSANQPHRWDGS